MDNDILSALNILRAASDETLRAHSEAAILTLRHISERLQVNVLSNDESTSFVSHSNVVVPGGPQAENLSSHLSQTVTESSHGNSTWESEQTDTHSSTEEVIAFQPNDILPAQKTLSREDHKPSKNTATDLMNAIKQTIPWLWEISKTEVSLSHKIKPHEDPRLKDVRNIEGESKASKEDRLFRLLAIRSLALEFTDHQIAENSQTKVEELVDYVRSVGKSQRDLAKTKKGRRSGISDFVKSDPGLSESSDLANRAINGGIKHLVFEKALVYRLLEKDLPTQVDVISAVLGQNITRFRNVTYKGMSEVVDVLLSEESQVILPDDTGENKSYSVMEVLQNANKWFMGLQAQYNGFHSKTYARVYEEGPFAKRARYDSPSCASQDYSSSPPDDDESFATYQNESETRADERSNANDLPPPRPLPNQNGPQLVNFNRFEDFYPVQDIGLSNPADLIEELFPHFDPVADVEELFRDIDPLENIEHFQDFNPEEDIHTSFSHLYTAATATNGQDVEIDRQDDKDTTIPISTRTPHIQSVY